jgi:hypothetical protein
VQKLGLGTDIWTVPFGHITKQLEVSSRIPGPCPLLIQYLLKLLYVAEICYMAAEALTQLSFLAFYLRIFPDNTFHWIAYGLMCLSVCFGISNTFVMIFQCTPVPYFWTGWTGVYLGSCTNINTYSWYKAVMQIAMDLSILGSPQALDPIVSQLQQKGSDRLDVLHGLFVSSSDLTS